MRAIFIALIGASIACLASAQDFEDTVPGGAARACFAQSDGGEAGLSAEEISASVARCANAPPAQGTDKAIMQRPGDGAANVRACISFVKNQYKRPRPAPPSPAKYSDAEARAICMPGGQ